MTLSRSPEDQERLIACVREALAIMDRGETVDPSVVCSEHPHLAGPLAEVLGLSDCLVDLQQEALREDPLAGLLLADRYQLTRCLGRGAMGVVYHADDRELRREVAVKILDARLFRDEAAEQRFQREAEVLAALHHRNVVAVFDRGRTPEGIHYLVMELLDGATLSGLLEDIDGGAPATDAFAVRMGEAPAEAHWPRLVASWGRDLARGLGAAHAQDLVHRDVKPSNVFLAIPGRPVLLDFGIAARNSDERLTATQSTLGTPWYMAPEQVAAGGLLAARPTLDVYGLGATLYHLLAGRPPYEGDAAAVLAALPNRDPTPLLQLRSDLPRDLVAIVEKGLERDPARRYADGDALADDLDAFLRHQPVSARPLTRLQRRLRQWRRAPARPIAVLAVLLLLLVAAIAWPILHERRQADLRARQLALYRELPTLLAIEGWPDERVLSELQGEHEAAIAQLDRLLELDETDLPVRLWRACLLLDLDRRDAAARDLDTIARQRDSALFRELAQRYAAADPEQRGTLAIDLEGMPEPHTPQELYVMGFHELRNRHVGGYAERADALLARAAADYLPARDLRLLAIGSRCERSRSPERERLAQLLYDETVALETIYGTETARTQTMRGVALLFQEDYERSVPLLLRSIELRPGRHSPHNNLGIAYRHLDRLGDAERHLHRALELRPFAWNSRYTLAQVLRDRGSFDEAREAAMALDDGGSDRRAWLHERLRASIALADAMACIEHDPARAREQAAVAAEHCRAWQAISDTPAARQQLAITTALANGDANAALVPFLAAMDVENDSAYSFANLAYLLPDAGLDREQTAWLGSFVRRLAIARAGDDENLRARLEQEIEATLAPFR